jgi:hypothetical protein
VNVGRLTILQAEEEKPIAVDPKQCWHDSSLHRLPADTRVLIRRGSLVLEGRELPLRGG